jgi:mRNA interferase MazF
MWPSATATTVSEIRRGSVVWAELDPVRYREQAGRRPVLVVASDLYLEQADTLAIVVPATTTDRGWPNHVPLRGEQLDLPQATFAMTEQPRTITRDRLVGVIGVVDSATMRDVDRWLRDFLALP